MASRRSRLKAVANLPIRRKPLSAQQEVENTQLQDEKIPEVETGEKQGENASEEAIDIEKTECSGIIENIPASVPSPVNSTMTIQQESEKNTAAEDITAENNVCNKSTPSRFGRRVKPSVSLAMLKERTPRTEILADGNSDIDIQSMKELKESVQNCVSPCDGSILETVTQEVISESASESVDNIIIVLSNEVEQVPVESVAQENNYQSQCHEIATDVVENQNSETRNLKSPLVSQTDDLPTSALNSIVMSSQEASNRPKNDIQSNKSPIEHTNHVVPLNNSQFQCSGTNVKKTTSSGKPKKGKLDDSAKKVADAKREFQKKYDKFPPDRSSLKMIDLIFYNPSTNPMEYKTNYRKRYLQSMELEMLNEDRVDDPESVDQSLEANDDLRGDEYGKMPVPQVKIGLNGEIILDEKSLVIETTDARKGREDLQNSVPIFEDKGSKTSYYKRKTIKPRDWSDLETKRFYKALNTIGTDFSLMQKYFPVRTRLELKNKFKREEKLNRRLIDRALNNPSEFDINQFEKYVAAQMRVQDEEDHKVLFQRKIRIKKTESRVRSLSLLSKEITESEEVNPDSQCSADAEQTGEVLEENERSNDGTDGLREKDSPVGIQQIIITNSCEGDRSKLFTNVGLNDVRNPGRIRDAFDEIHNANSDVPRPVSVNKECSYSGGKNQNAVEEFCRAVVNFSSSLKSCAPRRRKVSEICRRSKQVKPDVTRADKRKCPSQVSRKKGKKQKVCPFINTLDVETYVSHCDAGSSSEESNDNSLMSTKTITDQDFLKLLAANAQNMKESKIQFQITEDCSLGKNVEIILDSVPSIAFGDV